MDEHSKEQALAEEILADARRQAERKVGRARKRAEQILQSARSQIEDIEEKAAEAAAEKVARETQTIMADVPHQEQVRTLQVKAEVIARVFAESLEALKAQMGSDAPAVLARLSSDAISLMPGRRFILEVGARDAEQYGTRLAEETVAEVERTQNQKVTAEVAVSPEITDGGVIVKSADGPQMVDNSFATRLRRAQESLRSQIAEIIFGDESE